MTSSPSTVNSPFIWTSLSTGGTKRKRPSEAVPEDDSDGSEEEDEEGYFVKWTRTEGSEEEGESPSGATDDVNNAIEIYCTFTPMCRKLPPFKSIAAYQTHHTQLHELACQDCGRILPTQHLLSLHLDELHSSYFAAKVEKLAMEGKMEEKEMEEEETANNSKGGAYRCWVDNCDSCFLNPTVRKTHLKAIHKYPKKFNWNIVAGVEGRKGGGGGGGGGKAGGKKRVDLSIRKRTDEVPKASTSSIPKKEEKKGGLATNKTAAAGPVVGNVSGSAADEKPLPSTSASEAPSMDLDYMETLASSLNSLNMAPPRSYRVKKT